MKNKKKRIIKISIMLFVILNCVCAIFYIFELNKLKIINTQIENKISQRQKIKNDNYNHNKTMQSLEYFSKSALNMTKFQNVYIEDSNVNIIGNIENDDYVSLIKSIETGNKFNIKDMHLPSKKNNTGEFKIDLELK